MYCRIYLNLIELYGSLQGWNIKLYTIFMYTVYQYATSSCTYHSPQCFLTQHKDHISMYTVYVAFYPLFAKPRALLAEKIESFWKSMWSLDKVHHMSLKIHVNRYWDTTEDVPCIIHSVCVCVCVCILRYLVLYITNLASIRKTKPPEGHIADRVWLIRVNVSWSTALDPLGHALVNSYRSY